MFKDNNEIEKAITSGDVSKIESLFDGSQYEGGALENMEGDIRNISRFCASLVMALINKKILDIDEIQNLFLGRH